jgi:diguanylate cyclase (GGDEF)-like protein/PAS domain S-box-containing protein
MLNILEFPLVSSQIESAAGSEQADRVRLRAAIDASGEAIFVFDLGSLRFADSNAAATRLLGYSASELRELAPWDVADIGRDELLARYRALVEAGDRSEVCELELIRKDGTRLPVQVSRYPLRVEQQNYVIGVVRDLTEVKRAQRCATESRELYRCLFDLSPLPMWVYDQETLAFLAVNRAAIRQYGYTGEEFLRMTIADIQPAEECVRLTEHPRGRRDALDDQLRLWRHRRKDGSCIDVEISSHALDFAGRPARLVLAQDVTARQAAERALRESNERFALVARATTDIVWEWDLTTDARWWNENMTTLLGYDRAALAKGVAYWGIHPDDRERVRAGVEAVLSSARSSWSDEYRFRHRDGHYLDIYDRACVMRNERGEAVRMIGVMVDITERKRIVRELTHHLTHDLTTGLPRFPFVEDYLRAALAAAATNDGRVLVLYVDLDYFHAINETRGRALADELLRTVAARLNAFAGRVGKAAHIAGDEFVVVLAEVDRSADSYELGERLRAMIAEPIEIADQRIYLSCSIGVSGFPEHSAEPLELLRQAEAATVRAKRDGRNAVSVFSNERNAELRVRLALGTRLRHAMSAGHLLLEYQPQISASNWQVRGFEALLRWCDPDLGLISPKQFVQAAEELGLAIDLGCYALDTAGRQLRDWLDAGVADFSVAVNVSPLQLQRPEFVDDVQAVLTRYRLPPACLELELTENVMLENCERMIATMRALKRLGIGIALDDFGTGYSSLNWLRRLPIDCLKIDQSFVREVTTDAGAAGICRAIIELGHQLGMQVIAEGVETGAEVSYLQRNNCDLFQGFYFSKAVPASRALELLRHRHCWYETGTVTEGETPTLLLVDDEPNVLRALARVLRRDGYRILMATSAEEAMEVLARERVGVIVSDQRMRGMTGTELLRKVKDMHPATVRMVLSGYTDLAVVTEAINQGAIYKFLTKPWSDEELRRQIQDAFRVHRDRAAHAAHAKGR